VAVSKSGKVSLAQPSSQQQLWPRAVISGAT
jgi:hypothetical protein